MSVGLWALVIFVARAVDVTMGTIRVHLIVRRRKFLAPLIGFVEVLIFILIVSRVIRDIQNWPYVLAYAGGFATGTLFGILLSERLTRGVVEVTIIPHEHCEDELELAIREAGFALTTHLGTGREGNVEIMTVVCTSRQGSRLAEVVARVDPKAFVYTRELSGLRGGYVYGMKGKK
jgi:uncharacterized protein YebE (UPF0316 family)